MTSTAHAPASEIDGAAGPCSAPPERADDGPGSADGLAAALDTVRGVISFGPGRIRLSPAEIDAMRLVCAAAEPPF